MINNGLHSRESDFHDSWAANEAPENVKMVEAFESPAAFENKWILKRMQDMKDSHLLDIGVGLGESSVYFAKKGAQVTATDLSPGMVDFAIRLGRFHGVEIVGRVSPAEKLSFDSNSFDFVYSANTLHHVEDRLSFLQEIHRVLKPGGHFFTWDPYAYNPLINIYRRMATTVRTSDEQPLRKSDIKMARKLFPSLETRFFWILSLLLFCKYFIINRIHPNSQRYWKKIYDETPKSLFWWMPLARMDHFLTQLPIIKHLSWNVVLHGIKEH